MERRDKQLRQQRANLSREGPPTQLQGQGHGGLEPSVVLGLKGSEPGGVGHGVGFLAKIQDVSYLVQVIERSGSWVQP